MFKFDRMFSNIIAIRKYVWASSSRVFGGNDVGDDGTSNANIDENDLEEENGDSDEDDIPNFMNDISKMLLSWWDQLVVSMSTKSDSTSLHMDWKGGAFGKDVNDGDDEKNDNDNDNKDDDDDSNDDDDDDDDDKDGELFFR
nr:protein SIS2-like [Populus alba]